MNITRGEVTAALTAFNIVRGRMGGIRTEEQQREAMEAALRAAEAWRATGNQL